MRKILPFLLALALLLGALPAGAVEELVLPIVQEPIEMTFFAKLWNTHSDWNEMLVWQEYNARTNIHVTWETAPSEGFTEKRNLRLAAEDLPDAFWACGFTAGDLALYGADGTFIPLEDLVEGYMPNLGALMEADASIGAAITLPDGHVYSLPNLFEESAPLKAGLKMFVQSSWLEALGLSMPTTTQEFYDMLVAFRDNAGKVDAIPADAVPLGTASSSLLSGLINTFVGSFGLMNRGAGHTNVDVDPETGALRFFRIDEGYRLLLQWLHDMYAQGLVEPEIFTIDAATRVAKGSTGVYGAINSITGGVIKRLGDYEGLPVLAGPNGDQRFNNLTSAVSGIGGFAITCDNPYPVETAKWMDYFYSDAGMELLFMGVEGVTFNYVDGVATLVEDITNNKDGLTLDTALARYSPRPGGCYTSVVSTKYFSGYETQEDAVAAAYAMEPYFLPIADRWPPFTYTVEEAEQLRVYEDLLTYVTSMSAKFVRGDESLDNWDAYVAQVRKMDVEGYLALYQNAVDRYEASIGQ